MENTANVKIPSNIMVKSSYQMVNRKQPHYIDDVISQLYTYIYINTNPTYYPNLEIEAKLGKFNFIGEYVHCMEYIKETFQIPNYDGRDSKRKIEFKSGLDESQFYTIWYYVDKEAHIPNSEITKCEPLNIKDVFYQSKKRKSLIYKNNTLVMEEVIRKEDKVNHNIRDGGNDFRITICKEMKTDITDSDIEISKRDKFRVSYKFKFFRLDFTIVSASVDNCIEITYEIEFELYGFKLLDHNIYQRYEDFRYLLYRYIENIFCIIKIGSFDYYTERTQNYQKQKTGNEPIFGDYLERQNKLK
jgi:hypothetical protein